jgi:general secretion pathway protein A
MYEAFFGLQEKPFNLTPNPRYLYLSPSHREALAHLMYGIQENQGFMVVTGEVGTGKTTLLRTLLERLDSGVKTAFVFSPILSLQDLLQYILNDFGLQTAATTMAQYLMQLHHFLIDQHAKGATTVLVIDEAQNLPLTLLEDIRMLSNLETTGAKLLQIVLVGQPELQHKLHTPRLRQLRQRISVTCEIHALSGAETEDYIQHRITVAGGEGQAGFTRPALKAIHSHAGGIPRRINILCDQALLTAYAEGQQRISRRMVRQAVRDLESPSYRGILAGPFRKVVASLAGLVLLITAWYVMQSVDLPRRFLPQVRASLWRLYQLDEVNVPVADMVMATPASPATATPNALHEDVLCTLKGEACSPQPSQDNPSWMTKHE